MKRLTRQWEKVVAATSVVDAVFVALRLISLLGGVAWFLVAPRSAADKQFFAYILTAFFLYSITCYVVLFLRPGWLRKIYLTTLFFDLLFLSSLLLAEKSFENSFFLGYYLLVSLHTMYFGLSFGLLVATLAALCYLGSVHGLLLDFQWIDMSLRIAFLYLIVVPLGLLTGKLEHDKQRLAGLNDELRSSLAHIKSIQQKLIEAEKLSALGRLTADVAHEIRNPLTALGGFARRLSRKTASGSKEREYAEIIIKEASRLEKILGDILTYGKTANFGLQRESLAVPIGATAALFREICHEQGVALIEQHEPGSPKGRINTDHVQQALSSLVSNSLDAMTAGGTLTLATGLAHRNGITYLTITATDTGTGIADGIRSYIFEPFFSTKQVGQGTGLGLAIVEKIMVEHRGLVEFSSNPGQTRFQMLFPYQSEEADQLQPCWEFMNCGIATDSARQCAAYPDFGRICWATAGTRSPGRVTGICASKLGDCAICTFFQQVNNCLPMFNGGVASVIGDQPPPCSRREMPPAGPKL